MLNSARRMVLDGGNRAMRASFAADVSAAADLVFKTNIDLFLPLLRFWCFNHRLQRGSKRNLAIILSSNFHDPTLTT